MPERIKKRNLITLSVILSYFMILKFSAFSVLLCFFFFFSSFSLQGKFNEAYLLVSMVFQRRITFAESKEIYRIKQGTNVLSLVTHINLTFGINYIELFFLYL